MKNFVYNVVSYFMLSRYKRVLNHVFLSFGYKYLVKKRYILQ